MKFRNQPSQSPRRKDKAFIFFSLLFLLVQLKVKLWKDVIKLSKQITPEECTMPAKRTAILSILTGWNESLVSSSSAGRVASNVMQCRILVPLCWCKADDEKARSIDVPCSIYKTHRQHSAEPSVNASPSFFIWSTCIQHKLGWSGSLSPALCLCTASYLHSVCVVIFFLFISFPSPQHRATKTLPNWLSVNVLQYNFFLILQ